MAEGNKANSKDGGATSIFAKWWFWLIVAFLLVGGVGYFMNPTKYTSESDSQPSNEQANAPESNVNAQGELTESDVEYYCQDVGMLKKYIDTNVIDVYRLLDQQEQTGKFGWVDADGNDVWYARWNGKNKVTDESVRFDCWVSGPSADELRLHKLEIGGVPYVDTVSSTVFTEVGGDPVTVDSGL